jgi:alpha-beta hydrolase superfamily lysophospholipase
MDAEAYAARVLRLPDGTEIFTREWAPPDGVAPRGSILLVHGLGEHCGRYDHVAARMGAIGLTVHGYDLRGHGRSEGPRGSIPTDDALLDDLRFVFERIEPAPIVLGHSLGGMLAARAVAAGRLAPPALVMSSPALALPVDAARRAALRIARRLIPDRALPNMLPVGKLSQDPAEVAAYRSDPLVHDRITPRMFWFLHDGGAAVRRDAAKIGVPALLLASGADGIVDPAGSRELAAALPPSATARIYDDLYHEIFNEREPDRTRVLDDLVAWVEQRLPGAPRAAL